MEITKTRPITLSDGTVLYFEYTPRGAQEVSAPMAESFQKVVHLLKSLSTDLRQAFISSKPDKVQVKLGVEISVESGQLTALIVKGSGKGNLEVTLEWDNLNKGAALSSANPA